MWNEILGALAILAMVVLCANASRLGEAVCDRIRYGVQTQVDDIDDEPEPKPVRAEPATPKPVAKAAATTASSQRAAA